MSASASATCLPTSTSARVTISSPAQLALPTPSTWVVRNGTSLTLDGQDFVAVGANVYWLGLDENVVPNPSYPSRSRVLEAMAIASAMGATTIRATTLGVSVGTALSVEHALGQFNEEAFAAIDWAVWAAKSYGLRLVLPLTDQWDYYHGGIATFLRWRGLDASDHSPFYNITSDVYADFTTYVTSLISHRSNITGLTMAEEPTILAFETGNELGGWGLNSYPPPVQWTSALSAHLKSLAPNTLVLSGSYGVRQIELGIDTVDLYSDHYYPPYTANLNSAAERASGGGKVFLAGEYDWTDRYYHPLIYLAVLAPVALAGLIWLLPGRWWPWSVSCGCCRRRGRGRGTYEGVQDSALDVKKISNQTSPGDTYPPRLSSSPRRAPRAVRIQRWHLSLALVIILCPLLGGLIHLYLPSSLTSFLSASNTLTLNGKSSGALYWSLFGRDDTCCAYVEHHDGYTLHYPAQPGTASATCGKGMQDRVLELTRNAWIARGATPAWLASGQSLQRMSVSDLPAVACPQAALAVPANASWTGGNGTLGEMA